MRLVFYAIIFVILCLSAVSAEAEPKKLLIIEVSTGNNVSASAEFVEIYNPNNEIINLDGYKLEYKSAEGTTWSTKSSLTGKLGPRGRYLLVTSQSKLNGSMIIGSGLPSAGGHLRISNADTILDQLGWGTANLPEDLAAPTHLLTESLKRLVDEDGNFVDNNNNFLDFFLSAKPSPSFDSYTEPTQQPSPVTPANPTTKPVTPSESNSSNTSAKKGNYPAVELSELFIDPKTPQTDKEDEFIEIYNPNDQAVDLTKYQIQSGSTTWRYKYEIESKIIQPKSFMAFFPEDSGLTLSNGNAKAQVLDPNGKVLDGVVYEKAKSGLSLIKVDGKWMWASTATPDQPNKADAQGSEGENDAEENATEDQTGSFPNVAAATTTKDDKSDEQKSGFDEDEEKSVIDTSVLVIVGGLALLYGLYEYRQDIRGAFAKLKRYFTNWRKVRRTTKGR